MINYNIQCQYESCGKLIFLNLTSFILYILFDIFYNTFKIHVAWITCSHAFLYFCDHAFLYFCVFAIFEIISHAARGRLLLAFCPFRSLFFERISTYSRHALHRPFPLRIKLRDKVAVSRWGGREGEKVKGKGVGAKSRRKGGHGERQKFQRTIANVTAWMAEQLSGNIFFYVAVCIVYSCKSLYKMFRALVNVTLKCRYKLETLRAHRLEEKFNFFADSAKIFQIKN